MKTISYIFILLIFAAGITCNSKEKEQKKADEIDKNYTDCEAFVKEYEEWTAHYVDLSKLCKAKPENKELLSKKKEMSSDLPQWGLRRRSLVNCNTDKDFNKKCDEITAQLTEVMETSNY
jgi:hypothetical protein